MDLNGSTACYQHCLNGITMCVQNQWAFLKVEIVNGLSFSNGLSVRGLIYFFLCWFAYQNQKLLCEVYWSNQICVNNKYCTLYIKAPQTNNIFRDVWYICTSAKLQVLFWKMLFNNSLSLSDWTLFLYHHLYNPSVTARDKNQSKCWYTWQGI